MKHNVMLLCLLSSIFGIQGGTNSQGVMDPNVLLKGQQGQVGRYFFFNGRDFDRSGDPFPVHGTLWETPGPAEI